MPLALVIIFGALSVLLQERLSVVPSTAQLKFKLNEKKPTFSENSIRFMSFGYPRVFSNLLWLRFLQNTPQQKIENDELSWIYFDLDTITNIDPYFYPAFEHGGIFLSVITSDKEGARMLLEKGVRLHPERWRIHAYLGYHYHFELERPDLAAEQYLIAAKDPEAPEIIGIMAARMIAKTGAFNGAIELLKNMKDQSRSEFVRARIQERIDMWKKKSEEARHDGRR